MAKKGRPGNQKGTWLLLKREPKGNIQFEAGKIGIEDMAQFAGFLLGATGWEAYKRGMVLEDVKSNLLELYMGAVQLVEEQVRREKEDGSKGK